MAESMRATVSSMLKGIDRYNPDNVPTLERYVELQAQDNTYDLEANLALLKLYQLNPTTYKCNYACMILLKALTNLPHTDFVLCKCLLGQDKMEEKTVEHIMYLHDLLEMCQFNVFWKVKEDEKCKDLIKSIEDFDNSVRKFICHVIGITYQNIEKPVLERLLYVDSESLFPWLNKYGWKENQDGYIMICNQEETVKTKNITEKIEFDSVAGIMAACR
ncbi:eukaryotic translation initiation factor 3 subunit k [Oratosquilla oratoria]|uniref:eukaryotic translation initiation factor 3 subunit k n=1 Tax=Oratosquilla oratoria TaxID=337810 RepID=UPI003F76C10B